MVYHIAICDDEKTCIEEISKSIPLAHYNQRHYSSPTLLLNDIKINNYLPDIIFMDIVFENGNGIDVVKEIQQINSEVKIIYVSGYPSCAEKVFETEPIGFLIKPITCERVVYILEKAVKSLENDVNNIVNIKTSTAMYRINKNKIIYIESKARKLNIYLTDEIIETYAKLSDIAPQFSDFCRCHQSFLVNYRYIISLKNHVIKLSNGTIVPISKAKYNIVKRNFAEYIGELI